MQSKPIGHDQLDAALTLLSEVMLFDAGEPIHLVVCGGSALIATQLVLRTTRDIDVLAIYNGKTLVAPVPLPERLCRAAENVKSALNLPENWLSRIMRKKTSIPRGIRYCNLIVASQKHS